jgi:signal transduction histidine kinase
MLHREGREVPVEASMMSLVFDGEDSVVSIFRDMTERNEMHARLLLADRMASVGMLAAGVAHEINNPLAYITTNLDFAIQKLPRDTQSLEIGDALREAREGARRVQQIVRDLKTFSRGQDDRCEPVDVRRVIEASINMAWNEIRHRARLVKDYGPVPMVEATEGRLGQVFLNLLVNAAQAIPAGQADLHEIRVCTRTAPDGRAVIEIRDSGAGIAPEVRGRLFEPFFTTKPPGIGTGLGLTICQRIVTSFGGEITVESEVGRGSTFRVTLPASVERATAAPPPPESQRPVRRGRILVIDDEPLIAAVIRRALAEHEVLAVTDGRAALARMEAGERFDVILCDLMMPNLSGMEVYAELLRIARDQAERVIFVTGGAFSAQAQAFLERVPNIRVDKPFDSQALRTLVNNYLR